VFRDSIAGDEGAVTQTLSAAVPLMTDEYLDFYRWDEVVRNVFAKDIQLGDETVWPRDTLFNYYLWMSTLQENLREYQELSLLTCTTCFGMLSCFPRFDDACV
jgi:hypothetical protein